MPCCSPACCTLICPPLPNVMPKWRSRLEWIGSAPHRHANGASAGSSACRAPATCRRESRNSASRVRRFGSRPGRHESHAAAQEQSAGDDRGGRDPDLRGGFLEMKNRLKYEGAVVPMITPINAAGTVDEAALRRVIETLLAGGVEGNFCAGNDGRRSERAEVAAAAGGGSHGQYGQSSDSGLCRTLRLRPGDQPIANEYFQAGANAVVAHPPI